MIPGGLPQPEAKLLYLQMAGVGRFIRRIPPESSVECESELGREQIPDLERGPRTVTTFDRAECRPRDANAACEPFLRQLPAPTSSSQLAPIPGGGLLSFEGSGQQGVFATSRPGALVSDLNLPPLHVSPIVKIRASPLLSTALGVSHVGLLAGRGATSALLSVKVRRRPWAAGTAPRPYKACGR